ncbi:unnamed protein product [Lymnaea stagnalis]|uniref:Hedgehog protein n=1 Tax=Lymnaea stagnalis TaxID=6523 RepID=A0AAV2HLP8_LYMST
MRIRDGGRPLVTSLLLLLLLLCSPGEGCGPGRGSGRRRRPRKLTPLVFKQHVPNVSENTLGASGLTDGRIKRGDPKFKDLVRNNNPDILFKDEEGTGADRIMSQRCKDKLNTLAISVLNQWPGVKLRVTEAWDEDGMHAENSLHYEGRAVDITTSDRDRSKYGMLARLAVEAGFDWVYYETRGHIHCSVKSDSSVAINFGGCFPPSSQVIMFSGQTKSMSELEVGDRVLSLNPDGHLEYSDVIAFLDRDEARSALYYTLHTLSGKSVTLTPKHLIYAADLKSGNVANPEVSEGATPRFPPTIDATVGGLPRLTFAEDVSVGQYIFFAKDFGPLSTTWKTLPHRHLPSAKVSNRLNSTSGYLAHSDALDEHTSSYDRVVSIETRLIKGVYAPLTSHGTIVVDGFVTSCYAFLENVHLAHTVFAPLRGYHVIKIFFRDWMNLFIQQFDWMNRCTYFDAYHANETHHQTEGAHWYARILYSFAVNIIGMDIFISL